jgi:hypothetical protein
MSGYPSQSMISATDMQFFDLGVSYKIELAGGPRRLREAILYVASHGQPMVFFGGVKLNKILWRADFRAFYHRNHPVTGRQYQKLKFGPAAVEMFPVLQELVKGNLLRIDKRIVGDLVEDRPIALVDPITKFFSPDDLQYLEESLRYFWDLTGSETNDESHGIAWRARNIGDPIPYEAAFFEDAPLTDVRLERFARIGREKGWRSK